MNDNWFTKMIHSNELRPIQAADESPIIRQARKTEGVPVAGRKEWWNDEDSKEPESNSKEQP